MLSSLLSLFTLLLLPLFATGLQDNDGYTGYKLDIREDGDPVAMVYETENTNNSVSSSIPEPDVFLNASVHVGEISVLVQNLTAKLNLDAQVLNLLNFNAGVDLSIDKVELLIQNVTAKVLLEARLANLVLMIDDVLGSIDLNPVLVELSSGLGNIVDGVGDIIDDVTPSEKAKRSLSLQQMELENNILYSINDFSGNTHTQRVLAQNGNIVEQKLDNTGAVSSKRVVGNYLEDMTFNGFNQTVTYNGQEVWEEEYTYTPFMGLMAVSGIFKSKSTGAVVGAQLIAEARGGGSASIASSQSVGS